MKHFGNVCNIDGKSVDPVDIITFGAPCQDLSIAGALNGIKPLWASEVEPYPIAVTKSRFEGV